MAADACGGPRCLARYASLVQSASNPGKPQAWIRGLLTNPALSSTSLRSALDGKLSSDLDAQVLVRTRPETHRRACCDRSP